MQFDELSRVVRAKLAIKRSTLSDSQLKALWCLLDEDDSNQVQSDEMGKFLRGKVTGHASHRQRLIVPYFLSIEC